MESWNSAKKILGHKYLALAFRLLLGATFIYAGVYKIGYAGEFAESIASYQIVPYWAVNILAIIFAWTELICGMLLVAGIRSKSAVTMIGVMLALFTAAMSITLIRGISTGCGCFSGVDAPMTWKAPARNIIWIAMAVHVYYFDSIFHLERIIFTGISEISHAIHSHLPDADLASHTRPRPGQQRTDRENQL